MKKVQASTGSRHQDEDRDTMRPEYDFSGGVRGKYAKRYRMGVNIVTVDRKRAPNRRPGKNTP